MAIFSEEVPRAKRGIIILGGLAAAASVLGLAVAFVLPPEHSARYERRARWAEVPRVKGSASVRAEPWAPAPVRMDAPSPPADAARVARAMDQSNARELVRLLMEAAAAENASLKSSMLTAIARSPASTKPLIQAELVRASSEPVRRALEEALTRAR